MTEQAWHVSTPTVRFQVASVLRQMADSIDAGALRVASADGDANFVEGTMRLTVDVHDRAHKAPAIRRLARLALNEGPEKERQ